MKILGLGSKTGYVTFNHFWEIENKIRNLFVLKFLSVIVFVMDVNIVTLTDKYFKTKKLRVLFLIFQN